MKQLIEEILEGIDRLRGKIEYLIDMPEDVQGEEFDPSKVDIAPDDEAVIGGHN